MRREQVTASCEAKERMRSTAATMGWFPQAVMGFRAYPRPGQKKSSKQPRSLAMVGNLHDLS